jgi:uncharacterized protein
MDKDIPLSTKYFERACQLDFFKSCYNVGIAYMQGDGCVKDVTRGLDYFKKACAGSIGESCLSLWSAYFRGENGNVETNGSFALDYASKACDLNLLQGCVNAMIMCRRGDSVPKDLERAKHFFDRANELKRQMNDPGVQFGDTHKNLD